MFWIGFQGKVLGKPLVVFTHVPKTAGSTMRGILAQNYRGESFEFYGDVQQYEQFKRDIQQHINKYELIHGHVPYGIHEGLTENKAYFTFLRDPIARFFSEYFFAWHKQSGLHKQIMEGKVCLKEYSHENRPWMDNPYIKFVTGQQHPATAINANKDELLAQAKERLQKDYLFCGITEYFNESVLILAKQLKWHPPIYIKKNVRGANASGIDVMPLIPKGEVEWLKEHFRWDYALYEYALGLFRETIYIQPPLFWKALEEMEGVINKLHISYDNEKNRIYSVKHGPDAAVLKMYEECPNIKAYLMEQ